MPKKLKPTQEDLTIFHEAVKGVKPLAHNKTRLATTRGRKQINRPSFKEEAMDLNESQDIALVRGDESISYKQIGVPNKTLRKLSKGQYTVDAILDLHGMTINEAKKAVDSFLQQCLHEEIQVALIIHGKGLHSQMPTLKNKLNHWLRSVNVVLAFCSAKPGHGSHGALYVLLKHVTEENMP